MTRPGEEPPSNRAVFKNKKNTVEQASKTVVEWLKPANMWDFLRLDHCTGLRNFNCRFSPSETGRGDAEKLRKEMQMFFTNQAQTRLMGLADWPIHWGWFLADQLGVAFGKVFKGVWD